MKRERELESVAWEVGGGNADARYQVRRSRDEHDQACYLRRLRWSGAG
jgi:hypothetical protein